MPRRDLYWITAWANEMGLPGRTLCRLRILWCHGRACWRAQGVSDTRCSPRLLCLDALLLLSLSTSTAITTPPSLTECIGTCVPALVTALESDIECGLFVPRDEGGGGRVVTGALIGVAERMEVIGALIVDIAHRGVMLCAPSPQLPGHLRLLVRGENNVKVAGTTATNPEGAGVLCVGDVVGQTQYVFHIIALALREVSSGSPTCRA